MNTWSKVGCCLVTGLTCLFAVAVENTSSVTRLGEELVQNGGFEDSWISANKGNFGNNDGTQAKIASWGGSTAVRVAKTSCQYGGYMMNGSEGVGNYLAILYWKNLSLSQDVEIPEDGEYEFSMRYVHRTDVPSATPRVSLKVTVGDVEVVPAFTVENTTPQTLKVTCSLKRGTQTLKIVSPTPDSGTSSAYIDEVSLRQVETIENYLLVDGDPVRVGNPTPQYGYCVDLPLGEKVEATMPESASAVDGEVFQCIGWRLYSYSTKKECWTLRAEGAGRSCSIAYKGGANRLEWVWAHPTSASSVWVGDENEGEWQLSTLGEELVQNGGFEDSWITANSGNFGNNDGTQAKIASWDGSSVRVAKTSSQSGYVMNGSEGVGNYLAILYWKGLTLSQDVEIPEDGEYEFSMRYVHRTDAPSATPRVSLKVTVGDVEVVPAFTVENTTPQTLKVTCSLKQGTQTLKIVSPTPNSGMSSAYIDEVSLRQMLPIRPTEPCVEVVASDYDDAKGKLHYDLWIPWAGGDEDSADVSLLSRRDTKTDWRQESLGWKNVGELVFGKTTVPRGAWHYLAKVTNSCGTAFSPDSLVVSTHRQGLVLMIDGGMKAGSSIPVVGPALDPSAHGCLSECDKEKMTHTASPVFMDGRLYTFYQAGETHTVEAVWDPTEQMRMTVVDWTCPPSTPEVYDPGVTGEDFGAFVQTTEQPPCSQTMIGMDKNLYLFFRGRPADEPTKSLWCYRLFDTVRQKLADGAVICTLDGEEFNGVTAAASYNRLSGESRDAGGIGDECNIRLFSDGWYYTTPCICGDRVALIVRSRNLKDWESVAVTPNLEQGATMEHDTAELAPGKWISAWRQEQLGCVYSAVYDVQSQTWSQPQKVPDSIAVKPYLFRYKGVNYLAANISGTVTTDGYKAVRATLAIFSIGQDGSLTKVKTIVNPTGCHYVQTFEDGLGRLYLVYSTDERKLDATQCRSNIAFDLLEL